MEVPTEAEPRSDAARVQLRRRTVNLWHRWFRPAIVALVPAIVVLIALIVTYRLVDPLPPHRLAMDAGIAGTSYDRAARQYAQILARHGMTLEVRNSAGAAEGMRQLHDAASGVQAALTTFDSTQPGDAETPSSLGGVYDSPIFIFHRDSEPITRFSDFRGKRLSIGTPGSGLRSLFLQVLRSTDGLDASTQLVDLGYAEAITALSEGAIDVAMFPSEVDGSLLRRALGTPGIRLLSVSQAEAIAKTVPGLKHVVLSRGLVSLREDIPPADVDLLASRNRMLVRNDLHPALQYLLLEAMREVHAAPGPFHRLGEFPSEQPNDLPLSSTAEAYYRSGPTLWQRHTRFWFSSLLNRTMFFVIPVVLMLIPVVGFFGPRFYRWLHVRRIDQLHRALGDLSRDIGLRHEPDLLADHRKRLAEIESAVGSLKVRRPYEVDLQLLKFRLRMAQEEAAQMGAVVGSTAVRGETSRDSENLSRAGALDR